MAERDGGNGGSDGRLGGARQASEATQRVPAGLMLQSASLLQAGQVSVLGPEAVQIGAVPAQFASLVHSAHEPKRAFSSFVSQTGAAPLHPWGWPSSVGVHGRQYVSVPLQMGGVVAPAVAALALKRLNPFSDSLSLLLASAGP